WPFDANYQLHNRLFDTNHVVPSSFEWQPDFQIVPAPAVLDISGPYWISQYLSSGLSNLPDLAASLSAGSVHLQSGAHNLFGLTFQTALVNTGLPVTDPNTGLPGPYTSPVTLAPGSSVPQSDVTAFLSQTDLPVLQNT